MVYRKKPLSKVAMKRTGAANLGGVFTGTEDDMRRLSMDAAREVLLKFNVPDQVIQPLSRWHRVSMVRKLSKEHASGGKASEGGTAELNDDKTSPKKKKGVEASSAKGPAAKEGEKSKDAQEGLPSPIPNGSLASPSSGAPQPGAAEAGSLPRAKKKTTKSLKKRIISRRPDGTFASIKEIQITDPKEVRVGATQKGASRPTRRFRSWTPRRYV
eukprot:TRINITY_DN1956_c0_g2_i3.p1 TRINITY_DN1956_c0_g2~~TRINITY_DN1956_c0_g2_i3.p1  ORF type:complete len:214 (-),score=38.18 TRINITY_DN1956_c0_g2_i3:1036-1677(-)